MFDFLVPLVDLCDCHSSPSKEEKRVLKDRLLFQNFAHSIGIE